MANPQIVQIKADKTTTAVAPNLAVTFDSPVGTGRLILVFGFGSGTNPNLGIADNKGNSYTQRDTEGYGNAWGRVWTAPAVTGGSSFTVTLTPAAGDRHLTLIAIEISDWNAGTVFEDVDHYWQIYPSGDISPLAMANASAANVRVFAAMIGEFGVGTRTYNAGTGWTQHSQYTGSDAHKHSLISREFTSGQTIDPEFNISAGSVSCVMFGITIPAGSDGPGGGGGGGSPDLTRIERGRAFGRGLGRGIF